MAFLAVTNLNHMTRMMRSRGEEVLHNCKVVVVASRRREADCNCTPRKSEEDSWKRK